MKLINKYRLVLLNNSHLKELYSGTANAFILRLIGYLIAYLFTFVVAKFWGSGVTGLYILAVLLINGITLFSTLGLENSILVITSKNRSNETEKLSQTFLKTITITLISSIIFTILLFNLAGLVSSEIFGKSLLEEPLKILSLSIPPLSLVKVISQFLRGIKYIKAYVIFNNIIIYLMALITLLIVFQSDKNDLSIYISFSFSCYFAALVGFVYVLKKPGIKINFKGFNLDGIKTLFDISIPLSMANLINYVQLWIGVLIIGMLLPKNMVGAYGMSVKMVSVFSVIIFSVQSISMPKIGSLYHSGEIDILNQVLFNASRIATYLGLPCLVLVIFIAKYVFTFLGSDFNDSYSPFLILAIGQAFFLILPNTDFILQMTGKHREYFFILLTGIILQVILLFIFVPLLNITGAAIASTISLVFQTIVIYKYLKNKMGIDVNYLPRFFKDLKLLWN